MIPRERLFDSRLAGVGRSAVAPLLEPPGWWIVATLIGLVVGSFANVCIHRLPLRQSVVSPRSRCPRCHAPIASHDNLPVLSYVLLRGRCRHCRAPISPRYPAVEAANGAGWLLVALTHPPGLHALVLMALFTSLLTLALIDLDHHLLPDVITLPGTAVGLLASFLPEPPTPWVALLSAAGGFLTFYLVAATYRRLRGQEGLGMGDWKMVAMLGAFFGWQKMLFTVFIASLLGTVVGLLLMALRGRDGRYALPLGTFLALGGVVAMFVGDAAVEWYAALLRR